MINNLCIAMINIDHAYNLLIIAMKCCCIYLDLLVWSFCICQTQPSAFADKWYQRFFWSIAGFLSRQLLYFPSPIICICICISNIHVCKSLLFSSLLINQNTLVQPIFTHPFLQSEGRWWIQIFGDLGLFCVWGGGPKNIVGVAALPPGKLLRVRKVFARIYKITHKM